MNNGRAELSVAPDEYSGFVMTLLRLHTFAPSKVSDLLETAVVRSKSTVRQRAAPIAAAPLPEISPSVGVVQISGAASTSSESD